MPSALKAQKEAVQQAQGAVAACTPAKQITSSEYYVPSFKWWARPQQPLDLVHVHSLLCAAATVMQAAYSQGPGLPAAEVKGQRSPANYLPDPAIS